MSEPSPPSYPPPPPSYTPPPPAGGASSNRTLMLVLAYLGPLALIPFLAEKNDPEVQWHAKHGLVLVCAEILVWILCTISSMFLHCLGCFLWAAVGIVILVVHVLCIMKALQGQRMIIPGLSEFADKF